MVRPIHPDFLNFLKTKELGLVELFAHCRASILAIYPESNELLYHTHALTSVFSISDKLSDAFCMIPIYSNHLNLGFNQGTLLNDPHGLLEGTGKLIRHIPIRKLEEIENSRITDLIKTAINFSLDQMKKPTNIRCETIVKF